MTLDPTAEIKEFFKRDSIQCECCKKLLKPKDGFWRSEITHITKDKETKKIQVIPEEGAILCEDCRSELSISFTLGLDQRFRD